MDLINNISQVTTAIVVLLGFIYTIYELFKANKLRKIKYYSDLEMRSLQIFELGINHPVLRYAYYENFDQDLSEAEEFMIQEYITSILNLFEIQFQLRHNDDMDPEAFASWIPWFYSICKGDLFRKNWRNMRMHYIKNFRIFMDELIEIIETKSNEQEQKFYDKVSDYINCKIIKNWND